MKIETKVLFMNNNYFPDIEELKRLDDLQAEISSCHAQIRNECQRDRYTEVVRIGQLSTMLRAKWEVINGELSNNIRQNDKILKA